MNNAHETWGDYREREVRRLTPMLQSLGFTIDGIQPHTLGERALTGPVGGGRKLLLLGKNRDGARVVIKASSDPKGIEEIEHERLCRDVLSRIHFAYEVFHSPKELLWTKQSGVAVSVVEFIEQERAFLERDIKEQFMIALGAFKAQESAHATTSSHVRLVRSTFGEMRAADYISASERYVKEVASLDPQCEILMEQAQEELRSGKETIELYCGFLTHWDFVPQNFRIRGGILYLLDHSSLRFGNKYEGWARFINFMELYNPPLARSLVRYVADNRAPEETASLRLMRIFRLMELLRYYAGWLPRTEGDLHALARARIAFWSEVLRCVIDKKGVPQEAVESYKKERDSLRSDEEKQRQVGLH